ncbi:hypothetical protein [Flavonifractor phage Chenonceau]|nr:hypothetical protein [Flavonifractor phage Chenonceau]
MGVWERMPLRSHSLSIPFSSFTQRGWRRCSRCPYCVQYAILAQLVWRFDSSRWLQRSPVYAGQSIIHAVVLYTPLLAA